MAMQWAMLEEGVEDEPAIIAALQNGWQPFAVAEGKIWFRQMFFNEATEARSSAKDSTSQG
jgi:hypothetical protein